MTRVAFFCLLPSILGCGDTTPSFRCTTDGQCIVPPNAGICVDKGSDGMGVCAVGDASCASGYRYDKTAGGSAGECYLFPDAAISPDLSTMDSLVADMSMSPDSAADMPVTCGSPGLPCCNLTCNPGVTCAGAICQASSFWAAGFNSTGGASAHWDGNNWNAVTVPASGSLESISGLWGTSGSNIWAVGSTGSSPNTTAQIWHYDGAGWTQCATGNPCSSPGTTSTALNGIFGLSATDIWAVGVNEAVHWNGSGWTSQATGLGSVPASGVWCAGTPDCWIVSSQKMLHWNGSNWNTSYAVGDVYAGSVFGFASNDVWAGTGAGFSGAGSIVHWNGSAWSAPYSIQGTNNAGVIRGIWGNAPNDVWAVGDNGFAAHWDGAQWSRISTGVSSGVSAVFGVATKDVWAGGASVLMHWNGTQWTSSMPLGTAPSFNALWAPRP